MAGTTAFVYARYGSTGIRQGAGTFTIDLEHVAESIVRDKENL